jgi:predicted DNA-binding ribbon-helix-helix protein
MCRVFASLDPKVYQSETRSVRLNGQCTSIRLEAAFWESIDTIAAEEGFSTPGFLSKLHAEVLEIHGEVRNFTSRLRCICLQHLNRQGARASGRALPPRSNRLTPPATLAT